MGTNGIPSRMLNKFGWTWAEASGSEGKVDREILSWEAGFELKQNKAVKKLADLLSMVFPRFLNIVYYSCLAFIETFM